ncbi:threonylcarbamoyl-AMP synthase [Mesobaculum littorinae]|uniref:Threonylcarbamoyl-AMP synthase n=1 Tax=Mesobaculum littorinae TaxID=2486419 RepID=A0A438AGK0_9RHOB|nr:L-threonylcarbamoyladenylate synthase [Mesobaculum littorinae]RVV97840.1 threonylcarbamoyl-AMP synthase [Mesobaculum littorinae]
MPRTDLLPATDEGLARAAALLRAGQLVAFATETVYGLGADATDADAVAGIYAAKGRPSFNPLIVHVPDLAAAERVAVFDARARALAAAFWPGPLTLVLPLRDGAGIAPGVTAGLDTVAIRVPAPATARDLLARTRRPVAAPSANPSGRISPTRAAHVLEGLDGRIAAVLEGGDCPVGVESTILSLAGAPGDAPRLLRPGGIPREALEAHLGEVESGADAKATPTSPGQLLSHYAPRARLRLSAPRAEAGEVYLAFGPAPGGWTLSTAADPAEAAAALFQTLRDMDAAGIARIAVAPIPDAGLGLAINDRLRRAAAPRDPGDAEAD